MELRPVVEEAVWVVEQPFRFFGIPIGARMTLVRLASGDLWAHSPLEVDETVRAEIEALGPVRHIVAPSRFHYLCAKPFARHYPEAKVYGSPGLAANPRVAPLAAVVADEPRDAWAGELDQAATRGHRMLDEVVFCHRPSGTLIVADFMVSTHADDPPSARVFGKITGVFEKPGVPVELRWSFKDRTAARATVDRILGWDFDRIVLSHGKLITAGGKDAVRRAYSFLTERATPRQG